MPASRPLPRPAVPRRLRWLAHGLLPALALGLLALLPPAVPAQQAPQALLRQEAELALPAPPGAVAINADESILAAATRAGSGRWRVSLFDRPSRGKLGFIDADVGDSPRLAFSPVADVLLIAGSEAVQVWELPIAPLKPDQALGEEHRRWEVRPDEPPTDAAFGTPPGMVYWSAGGALYRRSAQAGTAFDGTPVWQPGEDGFALRDFAFDPESALVALVYDQRKEIGLLDLNVGNLQRNLTGHRFPVVAARFATQRPLLTLDAGNNLVQWQANAQPVATTFLEQVPKGFDAATFTDLGDRHLLLIGKDGRALAIEERTARPVAELKADGPQRIAVSATGRYVLAGDGRTLRLYGFARPSSPLAYVRQLRRLKAFELAQSYVRLMDDSTLTPQMKADLLNEAGRQPPGLELQNALTRLAQAEGTGDADRIRYWAEQVLALQADHPDAVAALRRLREQADAEAIRQAQQALEVGQNRVAISLLSDQVQPDSTHYPEAVRLIREAEAQRSVETALVQAREKLSLGDFVAAEALVREVLRKDDENQAALALLEEIEDRSGTTQRRLWAPIIGAALAVLLVGFVYIRFRRRLAPYARKLRLDEDEDPRSPFARGPGRPQAFAGAAAHAAPEPHEPQRDRAPPRPAGAGAARRQVVETLIKDTEDRLNRLREADVLGRHTARLMELEAELSAIQRRAADPAAELGPLHARLKTIHEQVRSVRIEPQPGAASGSQADPRAGAQPGAQARARAGRMYGEGRTEGNRTAGGRTEGSRTANGQTEQQRAGGNAHTGTRQEPPPTPPDAAADDSRTHYDVLQLTPKATQEEIRAAYHKLVKQYHPDLHTASQFDWVRSESERMSRLISEAYRVLGDATTRARYDRELRTRRKAQR